MDDTLVAVARATACCTNLGVLATGPGVTAFEGLDGGPAPSALARRP